jgi:hypothetical protein
MAEHDPQPSLAAPALASAPHRWRRVPAAGQPPEGTTRAGGAPSRT